jgi:uncharacterized OsmC-like protein
VSLDGADHLLTRHEDAIFVANTLAAFVERVLPAEKMVKQPDAGVVRVRETGHGRYQQEIAVEGHRLIADEPASVGGDGTGPSPYDYLSAALGACTTMTLRMYAEHKKLDLPRVGVDVSHGKVHASDCKDCGEGREGRIDRFERVLSVDGDISAEVRGKLLEIAGKCPVHKTLEKSSVVVTRLNDEG